MLQPLVASDLQAAQSLNAPAVDWSQDEWWKSYGNEQLNRLVAEALSSIAGADLWPTTTVDGNVRETEPTQNRGFPNEFKPLMSHSWRHAATNGAASIHSPFTDRV